MEMRNILSETPNFSSRPGYFSGRGANLSDLDSKRLTHIHQEVQKHFGAEAAKNFVLMVSLMPNMNATDFINNCYALERQGFKWHQTPNKCGIEIEKDESGEYNITQGMAGIVAAFGNNRDETESIRRLFLLNNGIQPKAGTTIWDNNNVVHFF